MFRSGVDAGVGRCGGRGGRAGHTGARQRRPSAAERSGPRDALTF
jgi:hypothetical protein